MSKNELAQTKMNRDSLAFIHAGLHIYLLGKTDPSQDASLVALINMVGRLENSSAEELERAIRRQLLSILEKNSPESASLVKFVNYLLN